MKRIFIGIKIDADREFSKLVSSVKEQMEDEKIKWVASDNMHLTLAFLGNTQEEKLSEIAEILKEKCEGRGKFEITLRGFGVFRNLHDPKVFWAGIDQSEKLNLLQEEIAKGLREAGIGFEDKPFSPHLTIGRIKHINNTDNLKVLLLRYHSSEIKEVPVNEIILYESILRREGPVYEALYSIKL